VKKKTLSRRFICDRKDCENTVTHIVEKEDGTRIGFFCGSCAEEITSMMNSNRREVA